MKTEAQALSDIDQTIANISNKISREGRLTRLLMFSFTLDIVLTIGLGILTFKTEQQAHQLAIENQLSVTRACETVNSTNAANLKLWNYLFSTTPTTSQTNLTPDQQAAQDKQLANLKAYINNVFKPEKCK